MCYIGMYFAEAMKFIAIGGISGLVLGFIIGYKVFKK